MITVFRDNNSQVALTKSVNFPVLTTTAIYPCEGVICKWRCKQMRSKKYTSLIYSYKLSPSLEH